MSVAEEQDRQPLLSRTPSPQPPLHYVEPELESVAQLQPEPAETASSSPPSSFAVACLCLQHLSSTFNDACYNFAVFLFLIDVFPDTLVPASLVGLFTTLSGLLLARRVGETVDAVPRLRLVRWAISGQKIMQTATYCAFLAMFNSSTASIPLLILVIICSCGVGLSNTAINLAVERDWVTAIASGEHLTSINTYMRRIDLLSKLCAPLIVSLFPSYITGTTCLLIASVVTAATELVWIGIVYAAFPSLAHRQPSPPSGNATSFSDWTEFVKMPVFWSSAAIATIYFTTLSYDGVFIAYVKAARGYDDTFIAVMRAVCLFTGLLGTLAMPVLEKHLGLERAGAWSIWFEAACLAPAVLAFFTAGTYGTHGPVWNSVLMFGGIALSRIGLWSFDLCQIKELQLALEHHPNPSRLAALQVSLQNAFHLAQYAMTLAASTPRQFKWTALISWIAVLTGAFMYAIFLRSVRGHLVHFEWVIKKP